MLPYADYARIRCHTRLLRRFAFSPPLLLLRLFVDAAYAMPSSLRRHALFTIFVRFIFAAIFLRL